MVPLLAVLPRGAAASPDTDLVMGSARTSVARDFELIDNRIFLDVQVNGRGAVGRGRGDRQVLDDPRGQPEPR